MRRKRLPPSIPRQLAASPTLVFPRRVEHAFNVAVDRCFTPMRANIVGPSCSATSNSACIAARHSSASCSALGSLVMKSAASHLVIPRLTEARQVAIGAVKAAADAHAANVLPVIQHAQKAGATALRQHPGSPEHPEVSAWRHFQNMSAVPPTTGIRRGKRHVCFVLKSDIAAQEIWRT